MCLHDATACLACALACALCILRGQAMHRLVCACMLHTSMQSQCLHAHFLVDQRCIMQQLYEDLMAGVPAGRQALGAVAQASDKANQDAAFTRSADAVLVGDRWLGRLVAAGVQVECMHCSRAVPASFSLVHHFEMAGLDSFGACAFLALINVTSWVV